MSFSIDDFLSVLEGYNLAIWPMQLFTYVLLVVALIFVFKSTKYPARIVFSILSFFWLFTGIIFCLAFWASSHIFGYIFGIACTFQGLILLYGAAKSHLNSSPRIIADTIVGILSVLYATVGYQIFGYFLGHSYPRFFPVGLVPCPTAILTFGIFLIMNKRIPIVYFIIPLFVSVGGILAVVEGIYEDIGLIIAGITGSILLRQRGALDLEKDAESA